MEDNDDHRAQQSGRGVLDMTSSAFRSQHSFRSHHTAEDDYESLLKAALQEAAGHPNRHRMAVLPSKNNSSVQVIDVKKLTTSKKKLVLSRAMETSGQDNEKLLAKIRERQDR